MPTKKANPADFIVVPQIDVKHMQVTIIGDSPLMSHAWDEKVMRQIEDKQKAAGGLQPTKAKKNREARDPHAEYIAAMYFTPEGKPGIPAVAFKSAMVSACRDLADMKMTEARGRFHIEGELIEIIGEHEMDTRMVRVGMGSADVRYRPIWREWQAVLNIAYNASVISPALIINFLNVAGFGVGVGEWRPEKNGQYGRFHVAGQDD